MSACRICLSLKPRKNITELSDRIYGANKSYNEIILFCLGLNVEQDLIVCSKLCTKCYKKVLEFYQFKALALQNEIYWKSLNHNYENSLCTELKDETPKDDIKTEIESVGDEDVIDNGFEFDALDNGLEVAIKEECKTKEDSNDELLISDIKSIKYEFIESKENTENAPVHATNLESKRRRGRPKSMKVPKTKQDMKVGPMKVCEECGKTVRNLNHHRQIHLPPEQRKQLKCEFCDGVYLTYQSLYKHRQRRHLSFKQECDICHKSVLNIKVHKQLHNPELLKFVCASCGRGFTSKSKLTLHMSVHTKDRPHECDICGSKFRIKLSLQMHKRSVHEKERSHLCQYCSKSFFKKVHLQVHLRSHTNEKPYPCPTCGKCFRATTTLKNHLTVHSEEKKHACTLCDMTFARYGYLVAHMKSHIKEKKFPCQYCDVSFHRSDHRKRHEFTAHLKHAVLTAAKETTKLLQLNTSS